MHEKAGDFLADEEPLRHVIRDDLPVAHVLFVHLGDTSRISEIAHSDVVLADLFDFSFGAHSIFRNVGTQVHLRLTPLLAHGLNLRAQAGSQLGQAPDAPLVPHDAELSLGVAGDHGSLVRDYH
jgi:hypothetical protein